MHDTNQTELVEELELGWGRKVVIHHSPGKLGQSYQIGTFINVSVDKPDSIQHKDIDIFLGGTQLEDLILALIKAKIQLDNT